MSANSLGNMGREPASYDQAAAKIRVFGDSFTSMGTMARPGQTFFKTS